MADGYLRYLTPDEYPVWDALLDASPQGSVFCRSWWLQAVGGDVCVLGYFPNGGRLMAGMPLCFKRRFGLTLCTMPKLTQTWGVVMEPLSGKRHHRNSREMEILQVFANRLAEQSIFHQAFHPTLENWLPFYWSGFKQTSKFTYVLEDLRDPDRIWEEMAHNIRTKVRKAEKQGITVSTCDADPVFAASQKTFARQGLKQPYSKEYLECLVGAAIAHNSGACFAATDQEGKIHAATFLIWDKKRAYYLAGGGDPELRSSGAQSLLAWHSVRFSAQHSAAFDFEGSVIEPIEQFFRSFGARQIPYSQILKLPVWARVYLDCRGKI